MISAQAHGEYGFNDVTVVTRGRSSKGIPLVLASCSVSCLLTLLHQEP